MPSLLIADTIFDNLVQELPAELEPMAREFRAFARSRAMRNPSDLLRAVLLYCGLDYSLREVASNFTQVGRRLSDEAVRGRLCACEAWLEAMLGQMLPRPDREISDRARRLILVDGTTIQTPGARTVDYRLHLGWDWMRQRVVFMMVTDHRTAESLKLFEWREGDVALADAGYAKAPQLQAVREKGAEFMVRCAASNVRLLSDDGNVIDIATELQKNEGKRQISVSVQLDSVGSTGVRTAAYLHAFRLPDAAAEKARRRMKWRIQKHSGRIPKASTMYLAGWLLILTSIDPEKVSATSIGKLYRARWQVEIVIKRLKSVLKLGALRARRGSRLAQVYLLGKSLYALMIEKRALRIGQAREVEWRIWKTVAEQIRGCITLSHLADTPITPNVLKVMKERPRKRQRLRTKISKILKRIDVKSMPLNYLSA